uniref:Uncharacterized protein n=1 Tax=Tanacetum cinerariifolium TaxID=118510 RepID=A0A6L2MNJ8_TANCI|nr:hypothetical protein [Tanacetum cinerariifolium]
MELYCEDSSPDEFSDSNSSENSPPDEWIGDSDTDRGDDSPPRKQVELIGCSTDDGEPGVSEDELLGQQLGALEKVQYFGTTSSADDEQALQRAKNLFPSAFAEIDFEALADIFKLQGNKAMQSKLYRVAIDYYNVAIVLHGDDAIYYCNRAAAYIQTCQEESGQNSNWSYSSGVMSVRGQVPPPLFGNNSGAGLQISAVGPAITNAGELYAAIRAAYQLVGGIAAQDNNSNEN